MSNSSNTNLTTAVSQAVHALGQSSTELGGALASTLREAAETVAGAAGTAANSVSAALPDLAAAMPATLPFVDTRRRRWRPSTGLLLGIGLVGSAAAFAAVVAARRRAEQATDGAESGVAERPSDVPVAGSGDGPDAEHDRTAQPAPVTVPAGEGH